MARLSSRPTTIHFTESAIAKYGKRDLAIWLFMKKGCWKNGVVFRGFDAQTAGKFGWGRSTFFSKMDRLVRCGLAKKDAWGNWLLANVETVRRADKGVVKHSCKVFFYQFDTEQEAFDCLTQKQLEMALRQKVYGSFSPEELYKLGRIKAKTFSKLERVRLCEGRSVQAKKTIMGIGSSSEELVKFARQGFVALNTEAIMRATGLSRSGVFAFKKKAKANKWITQRDRSWNVALHDEAYVRNGQEDLQEVLQGKFSQNPAGGWRFHQASLYKVNLQYQ